MQFFSRNQDNNQSDTNEGALHLVKTSKFHRRSRHIEHRYHYIRQQVRRQHLDTRERQSCRSPDQVVQYGNYQGMEEELDEFYLDKRVGNDVAGT